MLTRVLELAGLDIVIIETVGAGQSDVEVAELADLKIVVCTPDLGDDIQAIKAGILEIADILVVNKSDLPLAGHAMKRLTGMIGLRAPGARDVPVLPTTATEGEGVAALADAIETLEGIRDAATRGATALGRVRRLLAEEVARRAGERIRNAEGSKLDDLCQEVQRGETTLADAADRVMQGLSLGNKGDAP